MGGTESQVAQTARRLNGARFEVTVACLRARGPLLDLVRDEEIPIVEFDPGGRSEEHTSELQSHLNLVCRLLLEKKKYIVIKFPFDNFTFTTTITCRYTPL